MRKNLVGMEARRERMMRNGWWSDQTIDHVFRVAVVRHPDKVALTAYGTGLEGRQLTYVELNRLVDRFAAALVAMGIRHGDVIAMQLPNTWEFVVGALSALRVGAVVNPLMTIFRKRELSYMLEHVQAKVLIVPRRFRGYDFVQLALSMKPGLPTLSHVIATAGDTGAPDQFDELLIQYSDVAVPRSTGTTADDLALIIFTSGTTGHPKGVMHSANTLMATVDSMAERLGLTQSDVLLCSSPIGHLTGFAALMLQSIRLGATLVMQDVWNACVALEIIRRERVTFIAGSAPLLTDLCDVVEAGQEQLPLRTFVCGGGPVAPSLLLRAKASLGAQISSAWGMSESAGSALTEPGNAEKCITTDGRAVRGAELRIVDETGNPCEVGIVGHLQVRGALLCIGYFRRAHFSVCNEQGWFDTGDQARMDEEGYIRITGRTKDVLIRGGENVPVFEIESLILEHPAVNAVAIVGYPDERLGERACAFVVPKPDMWLDLPDLQQHLERSGVAKQYWPERLRIVKGLPLTPAGKVQKFMLRELAVRGSTGDETEMPNGRLLPPI